MSSILNRFLAVITVFCAAGTLSAYPRLDFSILQGPVFKGRSVVMSGYYIGMGGGIRSSIQVSISQVNGSVSFYINTSAADIQNELSGGLKFRELTTEFTAPHIADIYGYETRTVRMAGPDTMEITYEDEDKPLRRVRIRASELTPNSDLLNLTLQKALAMGAGSFNSDIVILHNGMKINVDFRYFTAHNLEEISDYSLPQEILCRKAALTPLLHVYEMRATGIVGLVHPVKYYYVFRDDELKTPLAFWGGGPRDAEYIIIESIR